MFLAACSTVLDEKELQGKSADDLYNMALKLYQEKSYIRAAKTFAEVERQYPYSNLAIKAQLSSAYLYYMAKKYEEAIENYRVFIQLHPSHAEVAYAYFMLGMCYYEQIPTVDRDQQMTQKAYDAFDEVVRRFPNSKYARMAKLKIDLVRDHLAASEMEVGRYYLSKKSYLAAINRFQKVIDNYQTTSHVPEALHRLVECYSALNIKGQAQVTASVLGHNYPTSSWYNDSYSLLSGLGWLNSQQTVPSKFSSIPTPKK